MYVTILFYVLYVCTLQDIQEGWWLYLVDKKTRKLVSPPQKIIGLKETSSVSLCT